MHKLISGRLASPLEKELQEQLWLDNIDKQKFIARMWRNAQNT